MDFRPAPAKSGSFLARLRWTSTGTAASCLAADIVALWFVSTLRHLLAGQPEFPAHPVVS